MCTAVALDVQCSTNEYIYIFFLRFRFYLIHLFPVHLQFLLKGLLIILCLQDKKKT